MDGGGMHGDGGAVSEQGKLWAAVSYGGFFVGLPIGILPLLKPDDEYALTHAKTATAVWLGVFAASLALSVVVSAISFATCGFGAILFPVVLLPPLWGAAVAVHGLIIVLNGGWEEPIGGFGLGERLFSGVRLQLPKV